MLLVEHSCTGDGRTPTPTPQARAHERDVHDWWGWYARLICAYRPRARYPTSSGAPLDTRAAPRAYRSSRRPEELLGRFVSFQTALDEYDGRVIQDRSGEQVRVLWYDREATYSRQQ